MNAPIAVEDGGLGWVAVSSVVAVSSLVWATWSSKRRRSHAGVDEAPGSLPIRVAAVGVTTRFVLGIEAVLLLSLIHI